MKLRTLGATGLPVSEIGFGCWGLGGTAYGEVSDRESLAALEAALASGIQFFDTSDFYGAGRSEEVLGEALRGRRERAVLASKGGFVSFQDGVETQNFSPAYLDRALVATLRRLGTDYLDLYQLHSPKAELARDEGILSFLQRMRAEGKIRHYGISVRQPADIPIWVETWGVQAVQVNFNVADQRIRELRLLEYCASHGVGVIVRTPLCFGFLTGKYREDFPFPAGDHRRNWSSAQRKIWAEAIHRFLPHVRLTPGETAAQTALRFCLSYPEVSTIIPGMLSPEHVRENAQTSQLGPLSVSEREHFERVYAGEEFRVKEGASARA